MEILGVMKFEDIGLPKSLLEPFDKYSSEGCSLDLQLSPSSFKESAYSDIGSIRAYTAKYWTDENT